MPNLPHAGRDTGQRWFQWINVDDTQGESTCPAYGLVQIVNCRTDAQSMVFQGRRQGNGFASAEAAGVNWWFAVNGPNPVEVGQRGQLTFDLPTWCQVVWGTLINNPEDGLTTGTFGSASFYPADWRLHRIVIGGVLPDYVFEWGGFNIIAIHNMYDENEQFLYRIGLIGGLVQYLHDGTRVALV